jgi:hypothetical protein
VPENIRCSSGRSSLASSPVIPVRSMTLPTPLHRQSTPAMEIAKVIPLWAPWSTAEGRAAKVFVKYEQMTESSKNTVKIQLITILHTSIMYNMLTKSKDAYTHLTKFDMI